MRHDGEDKQPQKGETPKWMKWAMGLFMAYMLFVAYSGETVNEETGEAQLTIKKYDAITDFVDVDRWRMIANPNLGRDLDYVEKLEGEKDHAACGQRVTLAIKAIDGEGLALRDNLVSEVPINFAIGSGDMPWDRAVRGMKEGGVRDIQVGPRMFNPEAAHDDPPSRFELILQSLEPNLDGGMSFSHTREKRGMDVPISCGEEGRFAVTIWSSDNSELSKHTEDNSIQHRLGSGEFGHGLDRGLVGMQIGEVRKLIIPPAYQVSSDALIFPKDEIAIVEVKRLPYKASENEAETPPESEFEVEELTEEES